MAIFRFWQDMVHRVGLKRTDKIMVGNVDSNDADYIDVLEILTPLTTDDLAESITADKLYFTQAERDALAQMPTDYVNYTDQEIQNLDTDLQNSIDAEATARISADTELQRQLNIALVGDEAFAHANRVSIDGGTTIDLQEVRNYIKLHRLAKLAMIPHSRKVAKLYAQIGGANGDFTFAGSAVDEINSVGVSTTVNANESRFDFQGTYVAPSDNSYYDADASTGKVTIPTQSFADGESWTVLFKGSIDSSSVGYFIGGDVSKNFLINNAGFIGFRSSSSTYYAFTKSFSSIQNVDTEFGFVCDGTIISLYIDGFFDSSLTPDFTELFISNFIKGHPFLSAGAYGKNYRNEIWNRALSASEVLDRYNGVAIDDKFIGANNVVLLTGSDFDVYYNVGNVAGTLTWLNDVLDSYVLKVNSLTIGWDYLLTYNVDSYVGGGLSIQGVNLPLNVGANEFTFTSNNTNFLLDDFGIAEFVLSNIRLKKLGNTLLLDGGKTNVGTTEIITVAADREFSSDTGFWNFTPPDVTISGGTLNFNNSVFNAGIHASSLLIIGKTYRVTYTILNYVSGSVWVGTVWGNSIRNSNGTFQDYFIAANANFFFRPAENNTTLSVDNISIVEAPKWYDKTHNIIADVLAPLNNPNGFTTNVHPILTKPKLLLEPDAINLFQDSPNPATQTIPTVIGTKYTCNIKNAGLLTLAETGGNGRGGIVTEVDEFTYIATATSMVVTVVTAPANVNFTATSFPLRHIPTLPASTATKAVDAINLSGLQANGMLAPTAGSWFVDFSKFENYNDWAGIIVLTKNNVAFTEDIRFTAVNNKFAVVHYDSTSFASAFTHTGFLYNSKVLLTWDSSNLYIYINGTLVSTMTVTMAAYNQLKSTLSSSSIAGINDIWMSPFLINSAEAITLTT